MDLPRLQCMMDYWEKSPPLHIMVKGYLGIGKEDEPKEQGDIGELMGMAPQTPWELNQ